MHNLRALIAITIFLVSTVLIFLTFFMPLPVIYLFYGVVSYSISYVVWPSKRKGKRNGDSQFLDVLEFIIELPAEFVFWIFRLIGRCIDGIFELLVGD
ncbi:hypothetical protein L1077_23905 [Pseudoalteromonas luteoviolacea]|uniref:hypothetical protein n=1 Tax=Pseudoalteromonas luteoviolacea TaxID=43657 RepID=UPI001F20B150|nr:hypothetical protein [Pseudoalteromonas luteoviolacea]MCF6442478.1 hypothetical protein [Pseudoalteromonas luteoviolacea]